MIKISYDTEKHPFRNIVSDWFETSDLHKLHKIKQYEHFDREDEMDIQHLPYMTWVEWMNNLSQYHVGVHMMPTHAAGTFALNCAFHGIPCIGYVDLDTQEELHPHLTVADGDMEQAKQYARELRDDEEFYKECSETSKDYYQRSLYNEKNFVPYITRILEGL